MWWMHLHSAQLVLYTGCATTQNLSSWMVSNGWSTCWKTIPIVGGLKHVDSMYTRGQAGSGCSVSKVVVNLKLSKLPTSDIYTWQKKLGQGVKWTLDCRPEASDFSAGPVNLRPGFGLVFFSLIKMLHCVLSLVKQFRFRCFNSVEYRCILFTLINPLLVLVQIKTDSILNCVDSFFSHFDWLIQ